MAAADYEPRCDGAFVEIVLGYLIGHVGERVHLEAVFGTHDVCAIRDAVDVGRHHGLVITAHQGRAGYTLQPLFARHPGRCAARQIAVRPARDRCQRGANRSKWRTAT